METEDKFEHLLRQSQWQTGRSLMQTVAIAVLINLFDQSDGVLTLISRAVDSHLFELQESGFAHGAPPGNVQALREQALASMQELRDLTAQLRRPT